MILMKNDFRVALVTTHIPVREIATTITKELIQEKLMIFHRCLKQDFGIVLRALQYCRSILMPVTVVCWEWKNRK